jgi:Ner family transcriptional regulator
MSTKTYPKKSSSTDWHPADIVAALRKAGWSLSRLSKHHGYCRTALKKALAEPWPHAEHLIAEAIGIKPWDIWPNRYTDGHPNRGHAMRGGRRRKDTTPDMADNVKEIAGG